MHFSVIICSIDAWKFAQSSQCYERLLAGFSHEIIGIHDASSLTEGYSRGMGRAQGDILIFSHDDLLILDPDFAGKIGERLQVYDILGFAGTTCLTGSAWFSAGQPWLRGAVAHAKPGESRLNLSVYGAAEWPVSGNIQAIDGLCMVATRAAALATGFDTTTFNGFHLYDLDFSFSAFLAGRKIGVCCDIPLIHASGGNFASREYAEYAARFQDKYEKQLAPAAPGGAGQKPWGRGISLSDCHALLEVWQPDMLLRATRALQRG